MAASTTATVLLFLLTLLASSTTVRSQDQQADRIIEAMIGPTDLRKEVADFLSALSDQLSIPLSATIFIPSDFDPTAATWDPLAAAYHIVPRRLSFSDLRHMPALSRLPTLLPDKSILITSNSFSNFTLNGSPLSEPDLFLSPPLALHGVANQLDFAVYGGQSEIALPGGGIRGSDAVRLEGNSWVVFLGVCFFLGIKILL